MARAPYKSDDEKKLTRIQLRVTVGEKMRLERAAKAAKKTLSQWIRDLAMAAAPAQNRP